MSGEEASLINNVAFDDDFNFQRAISQTLDPPSQEQPKDFVVWSI